jgi:hypothetical protein
MKDDCCNLYQGTKVYGDFVKTFLVEIRNTDEAARNPLLAASASAARNHFFALQRELKRVWELYDRLSAEKSDHEPSQTDKH